MFVCSDCGRIEVTIPIAHGKMSMAIYPNKASHVACFGNWQEKRE